MSTVRYLTVDCILRSEENLSKLLLMLKENIFVLWDVSLDNGDYFVGFETNLINTAGPQEDMAEFMRLFDSPPLLQYLSQCHEKIFDIGFESGNSGDSLDVVICHDLVNKISELGFSIKIRVYPIYQPA